MQLVPREGLYSLPLLSSLLHLLMVLERLDLLTDKVSYTSCSRCAFIFLFQFVWLFVVVFDIFLEKEGIGF